MMTATDPGSGPIVYIDRSDVDPRRLDELKAGVRALVDFCEEREPQLISYGFHLDEEANTMTVVAIHPDSASLEFHVEIGTPEFRKLAPMLKLRAIEVYGTLSDKALAQLQLKASMLGDDGTVATVERYAGFTRTF